MVVGNIIRLVLSFAFSYGAAYLGSIYAFPMIPVWYARLNKPGYLPPDPLFVPIGIFVYFLLGLALYFIWSSDENKKDVTVCLYLFVSGLVLNVLCIYVFFALQSPFMALLVMIMLLGVLISTMYQLFRVSIAASLLLIPYLIVCLIGALGTYVIFVMNPGLPMIVL